MAVADARFYFRAYTYFVDFVQHISIILFGTFDVAEGPSCNRNAVPASFELKKNRKSSCKLI
jgi:hypothetical protein